MVWATLAKVGGRLAGQAVTKAAPKLAETGMKQLAGKGGKEVTEHIFKQIGQEGGEKAGKKIFGDLVKKAVKGDPDSKAILQTMAKDIMKFDGLGKDALGLVVKNLVNVASPFGGGSMVRNLFGLSGNAAGALKPPKANALNPD